MEEECPVCYHPTTNRVRPCGHIVCEACIRRWVGTSKVACPSCRGVLVEMTTPRTRPSSPSVRIDFPKEGMTAGVTFSNAEGGVVVERLTDASRARECGLRKGDVVVRINDIPVTTHGNAVAIVDRATETGVPITCTLLRKKRRSLCRVC